MASTSLISILFRLRRSFVGVSPGSRRARENKSLRLSRATLDVAGLDCGGSKSDSISEIEGGDCEREGALEVGLLGIRESNARKRAAGVSADGASCGEWEEREGSKDVVEAGLDVYCS